MNIFQEIYTNILDFNRCSNCKRETYALKNILFSERNKEAIGLTMFFFLFLIKNKNCKL